MIEAMKQAVVYFEHMVRTLKLRDESEPAQLLFKLRQAIEQAERQETNQVTLTQTNVGIVERGMEAYEAAKKRGWVGLSDERLMEMPKQEPVAKIVPCYTPSGKRVALYTEYQHLPIGTDLYTTPPTPQRQLVWLDWLPEHKCGLHLSHNEHRDVYETVEQFYDVDDFISEEEWHKAVAEDSVWVLHWYPNTPVGFTRIAASTLEAIEAKLRSKNT